MPSVLLVGGGKMGSAMLAGWIDRGLPASSVKVIEPSAAGQKILTAESFPSPDDLPRDFSPDVVVLAVKPQVMEAVLPPYRRFTEAVFLSIAAGKPIGFFETHLGQGQAIVRAMPNTPAAVRRGVTVLFANDHVSLDQKALCTDLLKAVSTVHWIEDEGLMDGVTALSGSGPAYVFLLAETMAEAGIAAGLPADLAMNLARATVAGSGELLFQAKEEASQLRKNVTSPGGTTAEALAVLMDERTGLQPLMTRAVAAAAKRSKELAG